MKKLALLFVVSALGGILSLAGYLTFFDEDQIFLTEQVSRPEYTPVSYNGAPLSTNADFTEAANRTVHAVVHVKNIASTHNPFLGNAATNSLQGTGSGVIISPDGYIVTNNHVIQNASKIQVTLNNNENYLAKVIGTDPNTDIALLKIDAEDLDYLPFGDSDNVKIGEWVLAVGNPFNLTSTVTAGIVSAKSRDLGMDAQISSFIQTDAAVNPGNSGGALVNTNGELIGINTAITSQTGSYVGYAFAVPSNNARKIVEDLLEYGDVRQGILGIRGTEASMLPQDMDINISEGIYVGEVEQGSGAAKAGIRTGDIINQIDDIRIRKFSDLTGYIGSKRPDDVVKVTVIRNGKEMVMNVTLTEYEVFQIKAIGLEVGNATKGDLNRNRVDHGVKITRSLSPQMDSEQVVGMIITEINNQPVSSVDEVESILSGKQASDPISATFVLPNGQQKTYVWR